MKEHVFELEGTGSCGEGGLEDLEETVLALFHRELEEPCWYPVLLVAHFIQKATRFSPNNTSPT